MSGTPPPPPLNPDANTGAPIRDLRVAPTAIIPRRALVWVFGLCALLLIILIVAFGGSRAVQQQAAAAFVPPATPADPERLRVYERELQRAPVAAAVQPQTVSVTAPGDPRPLPPNPYVDAPTYAQPVAKPIDQVAADRARKEYESLFSSNVVLSKRTGADTLAATGSSAVPSAPPLDAITASVLRQMGTPPAPPAGPSAGPPAVTPAPAVARQAAPGANLHRVFEGTVLDTVLLNRLDGSGIAPTNVMLTNAAYAQDGTMVIPAGARVLGTTTAVSGFGAQRLAVAFHRVILPNGRDISLDKFIGMNQIGDAGLRDQVNNHLLSTFGVAAGIGLIGGLSQMVGNIGRGDGGTLVIGGASDATSTSVAQVMQQFLNRPPTLTIREGHRVKIYLTSDLDIPAYEDQR